MLQNIYQHSKGKEKLTKEKSMVRETENFSSSYQYTLHDSLLTSLAISFCACLKGYRNTEPMMMLCRKDCLLRPDNLN